MNEITRTNFSFLFCVGSWIVRFVFLFHHPVEGLVEFDEKHATTETLDLFGVLLLR
jgi:hypothetical protein